MLANLVFAFLAGTFTIVSPCVLPLLPIVLGTAASQSKYGPVALGVGVILSFVSVGLFVSLVGFSIGLDGGFFRQVAAVILAMIGLVLVVPQFQTAVSQFGGPIGAWGQKHLDGISGTGIWGQFAVGLLLGTVWSPCVGPTLGAASLLAAQGKDLVQVVFTMVVFALGVGVSLVGIGLLSRKVLQKTRGSLLVAGRGFKTIMGVVLIALALLILSHLDKQVEAALVEASPDWLTRFTTRF
jgi:cytochrome c-type biogenesis protein